MSERDTKFAGFARLLLKEMLAKRQWDGIDFNSDDDDEVEEYSTLIAQRAYDLVKHVIENSKASTLSTAHHDFEYNIEDIPDLTEWPEAK